MALEDSHEGFKALVQLSKELGLPDSFWPNLVTEDDWSFVIKLGSLFEAATTYLLVTSLGKTELQEVFSQLPIGGRAGRIAIIRALELLNKKELHFIEAFSEIRNTVVHNIENVNLKLSDFMNELDKGTLKGYAKKFCFWEPSLDTKQKIERIKNFAREYMLAGTALVLASIYKEKTSIETRQELAVKAPELI